MIKQYEKYKDSGISWMGVIPTHWKLTKAKYCSSFRMGQTILKEEVIEDGEFPVYSATEGDHYFGRINNPSFVLEPGDIVIPARGNSIGHIALVYEKAVSTQTTIASFIDRRKINCIFLYYFYKGFRNILFHYDVTAIPQITVDQVKQNPIVLPPLEEQTKIAQYLDHHTSIIDQLIQKKEKLIDLLKEKRLVVINEAVTKGLNSNAKMKYSGVEWLGEVPEHWSLKKLKYIVSLNSNEEEIADISFKVALENIESGTGRFIESSSENQFEGIGNYFRKGDVLFNKLRPYLAKVYLAEKEGYSVGELLVLTPKSEITSDFLFYRLLSPAFIEIVNGSTYGAKMPRASWSFIGNMIIPIPPLAEQNSIIEYINVFYAKVNYLIEQSTREIEKLRDYRQSIISEAITGKIDVRDWQPNKKQVA